MTNRRTVASGVLTLVARLRTDGRLEISIESYADVLGERESMVLARDADEACKALQRWLEAFLAAHTESQT
jgi:hypothetical protein